MDTCVWSIRCWLVLSILRISNSASNQAENCKELMFGGLETGANRIEIEEYNYINLTVYQLEASRCDYNDQTVFQVKISYQDSGKSVDLCKFTLKTVCEVSDSSYSTSNCRCLKNNAAQFLKKANSSDSRLYTWTWRHGKLEKQRRIFIDVRKVPANLSANTATAATTASVTCVFLGLVVAATVGVVVWLLHKAKTSREDQERGRQFPCFRSARDADNPVSGQVLSQTDDPYYVEILEPTASYNVTEQYRIHNYSPNHGRVKEQNTSQLEPIYFCGREQDEGKSLDPSYEEVKLKKKPEDSAYAQVKKPKAKI